MNRRSLLKGFTLTEVLVVLAAVTALAAVLFAVFSPVLESGRRSACQSNLRQLASATLQYMQDNDNHCPRTYEYRSCLVTYVKNTDLFVCPKKSGYLYNVDRLVYYRPGFPSPSTTVGRPASALPQTSKIWLYADSGDLSDSMDAISVAGSDCWGGTFEVVKRHHDASNFAFLDGHVKWLKAKDLAAVECSLPYPDPFKE